MKRSNNTYRLITFVVIGIVSFGILSSPGCSNRESGEYVAKVGNTKITTSEFSKRYRDYLFSTGITDNIVNRKFILNNMIDEIILLQYDNNENIVNSAEFKKTLEWRKNETILSFLKDREVYAKLSASEAEVRTAFKRLNEKIAARHIFAANKEEADYYYKMLNSGISFESLAHEAFSDSTLKNNGGYIGYFNWGEMDPAFEDAAYRLKTGEISKPVKTEMGYSIIQVTDRLPLPIITENEFINNRSKMERAVKIRKKRPSEIEYINNAVDFSKVKFNDHGIKKVFELVNAENFGTQSEKPPEFTGEECVEYGSKIFTDSELFDRLNMMPLNQSVRINSLSSLKAVVKGLYLQDALLEKAVDLGYDKNDIVLKAIEDVRNDLIIQNKVSQITYNADINDSLVVNFYETNENFFIKPAQINVQEIIVKNKSTADSLVSRINAGENFGELAKNFSIRRFSAENNGELGYADITEFGDMRSTFLNANLNDLIGPLEIAGYYGIFKVLGRKESVKQGLDEVYNDVKRATRFKYSKKLVKDYLRKLYDGIEITKRNTVLASIKIDI